MYTSKSIRLHNRCLNYLEFIRKVNDRIEEQKSNLAAYDNAKNDFALIRLMNKRKDFEIAIERWEQLSKWLENRYNIAFTELINERSKQLLKKTPLKVETLIY